MSTFTPTAEQAAIVAAYELGDDVTIVAGAGCLAADTLINVNRGGKGSAQTIKHVAYQSQGVPVIIERLLHGEVVAQRAKSWDLSIPTRVARAEGSVVKLGGLKEAWFSGIKETTSVTTESGRTIRATLDHPFLLASGEFVPLRALRTGNLVQVSTGRSTRGRGVKKQYRYTETRFHPHQTCKSAARQRYGVLAHRLVIEAELNGIHLEDYVHFLRNSPDVSATFTYLDPAVHVHHVDHDTLNNKRSNLVVLDPSDHHRHHANEGDGDHVLWQVGLEEIVAISTYGPEPTYDIEVDDDPHNFLANGFVVHNTGKTSTLELLAEATATSKRVLYLAFNKSIQTEAEQRFAEHRNVECRTAHSLAFRAVGRDYKERLNAPRVPFAVTKRILGIADDYPQGVEVNGKFIPLSTLQRIALDTVRNFCHTTDAQPGPYHVPYTEGIDEIGKRGPGHQFLASIVVPAAQIAWADIQRTDGQLYFTHDHYLKIWADTRPLLGFDVIFFDEAQDADPVIRDVVENQRANGAQVVVVGDSNQAIYGWRGAIDALDHFGGTRLPLSESFRFGPEIAAEANRFLELLNAELRIVGKGAPGEVAPIEEPDAVLCRTNAGTVVQLFDYLERGLDVHLVGGASDIEGFCKSALDLQSGKRPYGQFAAFASWSELEDYVKDDPSGSDLEVLVRLVNEHGAQTILNALTRCVPENRADVVLTTAHKAKGREWKRVRIHTDFARQPNKKTGEIEPPSPEYLKLAYVSVTRAKRYLDIGPLADVKVDGDLSVLDDIDEEV